MPLASPTWGGRRRIQIFSMKEKIMGKAQDTKKTVKKEPAKTPKEKKAAKKVKKEEKKHQ